MKVSLWTNKSKEFVATIYETDGKKAVFSVTFKSAECRTKFIKRNKLIKQ